MESYAQIVDNYVDNFCIKFRLLTFSANPVDKYVDNLPPNAFFGYFQLTSTPLLMYLGKKL